MRLMIDWYLCVSYQSDYSTVADCFPREMAKCRQNLLVIRTIKVYGVPILRNND